MPCLLHHPKYTIKHGKLTVHSTQHKKQKYEYPKPEIKAGK